MQPDTKTDRADTGVVLERSGEGIFQIRLNRPERLALREILTSSDYAESLAAFAEKRQPRFGGGTVT